MSVCIYSVFASSVRIPALIKRKSGQGPTKGCTVIIIIIIIIIITFHVRMVITYV
jgi:hypothetical protein